MKKIVLATLVVNITLNTFPFIKNPRIRSAAETFLITSVSGLLGNAAYSYYYQSGNIDPQAKIALEKILQKKGLLKSGEEQKFACSSAWANIFNTIYIPEREANAMIHQPITTEQSGKLLHEKGHQYHYHSVKSVLIGGSIWTGCIEMLTRRPTYFRLFSLPTASYLIHKKFSRFFEKQADDFMIHHASNSELKSVKKFFERHVPYQPKNLFEELISTHPLSSERTASVQKEIDRRKQLH